MVEKAVGVKEVLEVEERMEAQKVSSMINVEEEAKWRMEEIGKGLKAYADVNENEVLNNYFYTFK